MAQFILRNIFYRPQKRPQV